MVGDSGRFGEDVPSDIDWFAQQERDEGRQDGTGNWPKSGYRSMLRSDSGGGRGLAKGDIPRVWVKGGYPAGNPDQEEIGRVYSVDPA